VAGDGDDGPGRPEPELRAQRAWSGRAQAIAAWYLERKEQEGWDAEQLKPMLVALDELVPWLKQWHNEIDPEYGQGLRQAVKGGLEVLAYDVAIDLNGIKLNRKMPVEL